MTAPPRTDPATPRTRALAGSRRPRVLVVLAIGLIVGSLVRGLLLESYHVPSGGSLPPALEPGDRVLVLKTAGAPAPGDLVLVDRAGASRVASAGDAGALGGEVVGTVLGRFWPLDRFGPVGATGEGTP